MSESKEEQIIALQSILNSKESLNNISEGLFEQNDTDKTGLIEREEFVTIVNDFSVSMGIPAPTESDISELIATLDNNNDGKFNKSEFTKFIELLLNAILEALKQ